MAGRIKEGSMERKQNCDLSVRCNLFIMQSQQTMEMVTDCRFEAFSTFIGNYLYKNDEGRAI